MNNEREISQTSREGRKQRGNRAQEIVRITEAGQGARLKVVPGQRWALHFPDNARPRNEKLTALMAGQISPTEDAADLQPDALIWPAGDVDAVGLETMIGQVRDVTTQVQHYDYRQLAQFVHAYRASGLAAEQLVGTYDQIAKTRIQHRMLETLGFTGRQQLQAALRAEIAQVAQTLSNRPAVSRVLSVLKSDWLAHDTRTIPTETQTALVHQLTESERQLYEQVRDAYHAYVRSGSQEQFDHFLQAFRPLLSPGEHQPPPTPPVEPAGGAADETIPSNQEMAEAATETPEETPDSSQQLKDELADLLDQIPPPGQPGDPAIAPEDRDEYHTPPPETGEEEPGRPVAIFTIEPAGTSPQPLVGYFIAGRKSYFDPQTLTWSKRKQLRPFLTPVGTQDSRQRLSGAIDTGITSLPIPNGYTLDGLSLRGAGRLQRDQNGCFYIDSPRPQSISVEFIPEKPTFVGLPVPADTEPLTTAPLSPDGQAALAQAQTRGSAIDRALALCYYVRSTHFYPGGGDLKLAQALQYKLRSESTAATYISKLEQSEYLECYSANTLFIQLARASGIPARLVFGHHIEEAHAGRAVIDSTTGHAWAEIWDGSNWRRLDATPPPKPDEKKPQPSQADQSASPSPAENAQDNGLEAPPTNADGQAGQPADGHQPGGESPDSSPSGDTPSQTNQPPENSSSPADNASQGDASSGQGQPSAESSPQSSNQSAEAGSDQSGSPSSPQNQPAAGQPTGQNGQPGQSQPAPGRPAGEQSLGSEGAPAIASDEELAQGQQELDRSQELVDQMQQAQQALQNQIQNSQSFEQLDRLKQEAAASELSDSLTEQLDRLADAKTDQLKQNLKEKLDQMADDGFVDETTHDQLTNQLETAEPPQLDRILEQISRETAVYDRYEQIKAEVTPAVEDWFRYFAERLPHEQELEVDTDSRSRAGSFDRRSIMRTRNLLYGTVKNPRMFNESIRPKFLATVVLDTSGSMQGDKLTNATKLLVFYNELFSRISEAFGYIRFAINTFADKVTDIKSFDQDYASYERYQFLDGSQSTIKVRLMQAIAANGGTDMLTAIQAAGQQMNEEVRDYPDYASAMYFIGDGGDSYRHETAIREFLADTDGETGFGDHLVSATFLGNEQERAALAAVFGEDRTTVASNLEDLIEQSMLKFSDDIEEYLRQRTHQV